MYRFGLIGYPIQHSLSPWIHERLFAQADLSGSYQILEINPDLSFSKEIHKVKNLNLDGFNVTVPYKETIMDYLDKVDEEAKAIGAVNTVVNKDGKWIGYNTDGKGYVRALERTYPNFFKDLSQPILLLGAGGAARGIYYALSARGHKRIDIANRTTDKALSIAKLAHGSTKTNILSLAEAEKVLGKYALIIQTTSVGMKPFTDEKIISLDYLHEDSIMSDIVYQPIETKILHESNARGALVHYGHTMLLYQAAYAFEIWTNQRVSLNDMSETLKDKLEGR